MLARAFQRVAQISPTTLPAVTLAARSIFTPSYARLNDAAPSPAPQTETEKLWAAVDKEVLRAISKTQKQTTSNEDQWRRLSMDAMELLERSPPHHPYFGRSVPVVDGDIGKSFARLNAILGRNKVHQQLRMSERHEKKGVKRRRLESERWRRLFAHEVRKNVQLVTKIRNRGA
ncbi:hypothetical protein V5O48_014565 [Marasmius crinis-equi]|uniref:Ribosomal protein S21 n=1 Tax=Marasmius crinis-equi TaxID=585013 RepID=A0ABR3EX93_9AGAR